MRYIDIHSHLNLSPLRENSEALLARMREEEIGTITIGVDLETSKEAISFAEKNEDVWAGVGLHPTDNTKEDFSIDAYRQLTVHPKVVCIGECGLDYYRSEDPDMKDRQKKIFREHITLSLEVKKPLMIHARPSKGSMNAYTDALEILKEYPGVKGNFHFYVGDIETTKKILELGFTMSFDGPITFTADYDDVIRMIPLDMIHAETDAPFAAPAPYRGKTCEPWMVEEVVKKIANLKGLTLEETQLALIANAKQVFGI